MESKGCLNWFGPSLRPISALQTCSTSPSVQPSRGRGIGGRPEVNKTGDSEATDRELQTVCQYAVDTDLHTVNMWWTRTCRMSACGGHRLADSTCGGHGPADSTCGGHEPADCQHMVDTDLLTVCQHLVNTDLQTVNIWWTRTC